MSARLGIHVCGYTTSGYIVCRVHDVFARPVSYRAAVELSESHVTHVSCPGYIRLRSFSSPPLESYNPTSDTWPPEKNHRMPAPVCSTVFFLALTASSSRVISGYRRQNRPWRRVSATRWHSEVSFLAAKRRKRRRAGYIPTSIHCSIRFDIRPQSHTEYIVHISYTLPGTMCHGNDVMKPC